jgi:hypothetical protein
MAETSIIPGNVLGQDQVSKTIGGCVTPNYEQTKLRPTLTNYSRKSREKMGNLR